MSIKYMASVVLVDDMAESRRFYEELPGQPMEAVLQAIGYPRFC